MKKHLVIPLLLVVAAASVWAIDPMVGWIKLERYVSPGSTAVTFVQPVQGQALVFDGSDIPSFAPMSSQAVTATNVAIASAISAMPNCSTSSAGLMSAADKTKLNSLAAQVQSDWNSVASPSSILNKPSMESALTFSTGLTRATNTITVNPSQSLTALSNLTGNGFVKTSGGTGTLSVDTSTYLTANQTITISGDVAGSGTTAITATMPNIATAGTYSGVTINAKGQTTAGTNRSFASVTKTLVTSATGQGGAVLNASRDARAVYWLSSSTTATIGGASSVTAYLEIAATNSATASDWTMIDWDSQGQTITLAIVLQSVQTNALKLTGDIPAGMYARIRYAVTGTASVAYVGGRETLQ